jgi:hypothetical protein
VIGELSGQRSKRPATVAQRIVTFKDFHFPCVYERARVSRGQTHTSTHYAHSNSKERESVCVCVCVCICVCVCVCVRVWVGGERERAAAAAAAAAAAVEREQHKTQKCIQYTSGDDGVSQESASHRSGVETVPSESVRIPQSLGSATGQWKERVGLQPTYRWHVMTSYIHIHSFMHTKIHVCTHKHKHTRNKHTEKRTHTYIRTYTHTHVHTKDRQTESQSKQLEIARTVRGTAHTHTCTPAYTFTHSFIHIHTHIHTHTRAQNHVYKPNPIVPPHTESNFTSSNCGKKLDISRLRVSPASFKSRE